MRSSCANQHHNHQPCFQYCDLSAPIKTRVSVMWSLCTSQNTTTLVVCFRWSHCVSPALWSYCVFHPRQHCDETWHPGRGKDVRGLSTPHLQQPLVKAGKEGWLSSCCCIMPTIVMSSLLFGCPQRQFEYHPMLHFALLRGHNSVVNSECQLSFLICSHYLFRGSLSSLLSPESLATTISCGIWQIWPNHQSFTCLIVKC